LGLSYDTIKALKKDNTESRRLLSAVVNTWLKNDIHLHEPHFNKLGYDKILLGRECVQAEFLSYSIAFAIYYCSLLLSQQRSTAMLGFFGKSLMQA